MTTLLIKDLAVTAELDRNEMAAVRGGTGKTQAAYNWGGPMFTLEKNTASFDATQMLSQCQDTMVNNGNNVAFSDCITATVNPHQTGKNNITLGY